jgi:hypothetical protein
VGRFAPRGWAEGARAAWALPIPTNFAHKHKRRGFLPVFLYFPGGFARLLWWDGRIILLT